MTTVLVYVLMEGDVGTSPGEFLMHFVFYTTGSGNCVAFGHQYLQAFPQKATMVLWWFVELGTSSAGLFGAHVKTQL